MVEREGRMLRNAGAANGLGGGGFAMDAAPMALAAAAPMGKSEAQGTGGFDKQQAGLSGEPGGGAVQPTIRSNFADTALWIGALETNSDGIATARLNMPENLTGWKIRTWAMGPGTAVGEATKEVVTAKNLLIRMQAPRFFVEKDEVVLSANVHNYLKTKKSVQVVLELVDAKGGVTTLKPLDE